MTPDDSRAPHSRPPRIYFVGTDTGVGKTRVTCALIRAAAREGWRCLPFKPAQSCTPDEPTDASALLRAAGLSAADEPLVAPYSYPIPVAPGLADDPHPFLTSTSASPPDLAHVGAHLQRWEQTHPSHYTFIEGAGGLHVPMPFGSWQPTWIQTFADASIVIGRAGLGTINHCLLTIDALRALGRPPAGFVLSEVTPTAADPSSASNAAIIERARGLPYLGTLPHGSDDAPPSMLRATLAVLPEPAKPVGAP